MCPELFVGLKNVSYIIRGMTYVEALKLAEEYGIGFQHFNPSKDGVNKKVFYFHKRPELRQGLKQPQAKTAPGFTGLRL